MLAATSRLISSGAAAIGDGHCSGVRI